MKSVTDDLQEIAAKAIPDAWRKLKEMAEEWDKPELKTQGHWDSNGLFQNVHPDIYERESRVHSEKQAAAFERWRLRNTTPGRRWDVSGGWVKGLQNFRDIAKRAYCLVGSAHNGEESCDWLMERLAHFFLNPEHPKHEEYRKAVGLLGDREQQWAVIEYLFEAAAIFFHEMEILAPLKSAIETEPQLSKPFIPILRSKATLTGKEIADMHGVDASTIRKSWVEPNGPLKIAEGTKGITSQSVADHAGISLEDK